MRYICERYPPVRSRPVPKPVDVKVEAKPPVPANEVSPVTAEVKSETVPSDTSIPAVVVSTPTSTEETPSPKKTQAAPVKPLNVSVKKITCVVCGKAVYLAEKISLNQEMNYHSACFRCSWNQCNNKLSLRNYSLFKSKLYCSAHFQQVRFESEEKIEVTETDGMKEEQKEIAEPQVPQTDETTPKPVDKWDEEREKELEMEKRMKERREQLKQGKIRPVLPFKVTPEELKNSKVFSQGIFADSKSESTDQLPSKEPQEKSIEETESRPLSEGKTEAVLTSEFESLPLV